MAILPALRGGNDEMHRLRRRLSAWSWPTARTMSRLRGRVRVDAAGGRHSRVGRSPRR